MAVTHWGEREGGMAAETLGAVGEEETEDHGDSQKQETGQE